MAIIALERRKRERPASSNPIAIDGLATKAMQYHFLWSLLIKAVTQTHPVYGGGNIDLPLYGKVGFRINTGTALFGNYIVQYLGYCDP